MKSLTIKTNYTTLTIQSDEYAHIAQQLINMNATLSSNEGDELVNMAYQESKVIGADEFTMFSEYEYNDKRMLVAKLFINNYIVLKANGNEWDVIEWDEDKNSHEIGLFLEDV